MQHVQAKEQVKAKAVQSQRQSVKSIMRQLQAFSFTLPAFILLAVFLIYPIGYVIYLSFQRWDLLGTPQFIGWQNYKTIFFVDNSFLHSVGVTILFVVLAVPTQVALGLFLAIPITMQLRHLMVSTTHGNVSCISPGRC